MKLSIISILILMVFSGCSVKIYNDPPLDLVIKDSQTKQLVTGVKLITCSYSKSALSDSNGEINFDGAYETRWHAYPFPILSRGFYRPAYFKITHPDYNDYMLECSFSSLSASCQPGITKINQNKKELIIECEGCHKSKRTIARCITH